MPKQTDITIDQMIPDRGLSMRKLRWENELDARYVNSDGDTMTGDLRGKDFIDTRSRTINYDGSGNVTSVEYVGGRTVIYTYDGGGDVVSWTDGTNTWTINYDGGGDVTGITVT